MPPNHSTRTEEEEAGLPTEVDIKGEVAMAVVTG